MSDEIKPAEPIIENPPIVEVIPVKGWDKTERRKPEPTKEVKPESIKKYVCPDCDGETDFSSLHVWVGMFKRVTTECNICHFTINLRTKDKPYLKDRLKNFI